MSESRVCEGRVEWWRRRESNPRPKTFHVGVYILILDFKFRPSQLLQAGYVKGYPIKFRITLAGDQVQLSCKVDAPTGIAGISRWNGSCLSSYGVFIIVCDYV